MLHLDGKETVDRSIHATSSLQPCWGPVDRGGPIGPAIAGWDKREDIDPTSVRLVDACEDHHQVVRAISREATFRELGDRRSKAAMLYHLGTIAQLVGKSWAD